MRNTVLIIDDQWSMQEFARIVLQTAGYRTLLASDPTTGIALTRDAHPDAIVLDAELPGADRLLRQMRACRLTAAIPVILVTAGVTGDQLTHEVAAVSASRLYKPFPAPMLLTMVSRALHQGDLPMAG